MDIGKERRTIIVEPLTQPVPREQPAPSRPLRPPVPRRRPVKSPDKTPVKEPVKT